MFKKITMKNNLKSISPYFFILMGILVFLKPFGSGDELWNYNFARNILQGNIPYRDFSIVQTPLSCYISATFMLVLGDGLFAFRVVTYLLFICMALLMFSLCKKTTENTRVAFFATLLVMSAHFLSFIYNYNYLTALVLLVVFVLEHKESDGLKINLLVGFLIGATILIKQNTGAIICIANGVICLRHCVKKPESKKIYIVRVLCSFIPIAIYVIYLGLNAAIDDFIKYAIVGITTFTHRFTIIDFCIESWFFIPYLLLIIFVYLMIGYKLLKKHITDFQFSIMMFSLAWTTIIYPLADASHLLLVLFTVIPAFTTFYSFERLRRREIIDATIVSVSVMFFGLTLSLPIKDSFYMSTLNNYRGVIIDKQTEVVIHTVDEYIKKKEAEGYHIRIADVSSSAYKIPLDEYEKNWDMLLVGNVGTNSPKELIESEKPTLYLVMRDEGHYGMQDHYEVINYIKDNYTCVDQIAGFNVYANE